MLEITRAGVKDHGVVTGLLLDMSDMQGWKPETDRDRWDRVLAELLDSDSWLFLMACEDGDVVGLVAVNWVLTLYGSRAQGRIQALVVDSAHRRQGIGTELIRSAQAAARRRGCREVEASVRPGDDITAAFYRSFEDTSERLMFAWPFEK
jgi:ribosomal protein S18 acetylase RimI-like enzyme